MCGRGQWQRGFDGLRELLSLLSLAVIINALGHFYELVGAWHMTCRTESVHYIGPFLKDGEFNKKAILSIWFVDTPAGNLKYA